MASVTVYSAERMQAIEDASVVSGEIVGDDLILTKFGGATINAGNVRGATGAPGVSEATFVDHLPIGSIFDYIGTTNPSSKWIKCEGQTVVNAQTLYPTLWALLPASMKSGSSMIMPDTRGKVVAGYHAGDSDFNAIGKTGGSKTHILTTAELPSHSHSINHDHGSASTANGGVDHTHTMNHDHASFTSAIEAESHTHAFVGSTGVESNAHKHYAGESDAYVNLISGGSFAPATVSGAWSLFPYSTTGLNIEQHTHSFSGTTGVQNSGHTHVIDVPSYSGSTGASSAYLHTHTFDMPNFTGTSGSTGSGDGHNNMQPYITFMKILKVL